MTISNLTFAERARFADNVELRDVLETCADFEAENERLTDKLWDLEQTIGELQAALRTITESAPMFADDSTNWETEHKRVRDYAEKVLQS